MMAKGNQKPERPAARHPTLPRRGFVGLAAAAGAWWVAGGPRRAWGATWGRRLSNGDPTSLSPFERRHLPLLQLPVVTTNGAKVPVVIEMAHLMEPGHYIRSVHVVNERDPVPSKGVFHFTPANGQVYLAFQTRVDQGVSDLSVTAECSRHGRWTSTRSINIPDGAGGCAGPVPPPGRAAGPEIVPPRIRIPQLVKGGRIQSGEIIDVQLLIRHPNRTGLAGRDGRFVQVSEPFHLQAMEVVYGGDPVSRFELTSALSDDPFITFRLWAGREDLLRVLLTNNRGQRFEATHQIRLS